MRFIALLLTIASVQAILTNPLPESVLSGSLLPFGGRNRTINSLIRQLLEKLEHSQSKVTTEYEPKFMYPPVTWKMKQGLFSSYIHLNFHGEPLQSKIRNQLRFPDDNGFVTMNVLEILLDLWDYGVEYSVQGMIDAVGAIVDHQDKNSRSTLPKFSFWAQEQITTSDGRSGYSAHPTNIAVPLGMYKTFNGFINYAVKMLMLPNNIQEVVSVANEFSTVGSSIFSIPPDADDTGCALGVAAKLSYMMKDNPLLELPGSVYFRQIRDELGRDLDPYVRYAYRPYSDNVDESVIDPRTYHWIRHFLHERGGHVDLITTWFQRISDITAEGEYQKMPFSVNNVDGSVVVNGLYGIFSTIFAHPYRYIPQVTPKLIKLIGDSLSLVEHIIINDLIAEHAPSILLYYPSRFAFYYFVSRLSKLMEGGLRYTIKAPEEFSKIVAQYRGSLQLVMQKFGTDQLMGLKKEDISLGHVYWDDFLGNGDENPNFDDRVFSTAMAFNALINTWTESFVDYSNTKRLRYKFDVPSAVVEIIENAGRFLTSKEADHMPQENAFFSASVKDQSSLPFFGVTNYRKSVDGLNSLECTDSLYKGIHYVFGVKGIMPEWEYEKQSKSGCFNMSTVNPDVDYNSPDAVFPYWSAPSYTYAVRLLAVVQYRALL